MYGNVQLKQITNKTGVMTTREGEQYSRPETFIVDAKLSHQLPDEKKITLLEEIYKYIRKNRLLFIAKYIFFN